MNFYFVFRKLSPTTPTRSTTTFLRQTRSGGRDSNIRRKRNASSGETSQVVPEEAPGYTEMTISQKRDKVRQVRSCLKLLPIKLFCNYIPFSMRIDDEACLGRL